MAYRPENAQVPQMSTISKDISSSSALSVGPRKAGLLAHSDLWIYVAAAAAMGLKFYIAFHTVGTNDVRSFYLFAGSMYELGLEWTYALYFGFNHPPLVAWGLSALYALEVPTLYQHGFTFFFLLRLPGIIADFLVVLILMRLRRELSLPNWALIVFALSPVSLMVSGFHGNTDGLLVLFLVLAAAMCVRPHPIACGLCLALSCQIKIVPLLLFPIFFFFWLARRQPTRFTLPFAAVSLLFWLYPLVKFPALVIKNIFAYSSIWGIWGISYWLRLTGWPEFGKITYHDLSRGETLVGTGLKILIVACVLVIAWRRRAVSGRGLFESLGYAWLVFFIFSPGIAAQYMIWLAPFVLALSPSASVYLLLSSTLFLFVFYNTIASGLPWFYAVSINSMVDSWSPWSNWPWAVLLSMAIVFWRKAVRADPSFRLIGLQSVQENRAVNIGLPGTLE